MPVLEDPVAGCPSLPKRHLDIPSTQPSRLTISADGPCHVSPSFGGVFYVRGVDYARCVATLLSQEVVVITCLAFCPCCSTTTSCSLDIIACIWRSKDRGLSRPAVFPAPGKIYLFAKLLVPQFTRRTAVSFLYPSSLSPLIVYYFRWTIN
jgi:hypothetical protein